MKIMVVGNGLVQCGQTATDWYMSKNCANNYERIGSFMNYWFTKLITIKSLTIYVETDDASTHNIWKKLLKKKTVIEEYRHMLHNETKPTVFTVTNYRESTYTFTNNAEQETVENVSMSCLGLDGLGKEAQDNVNVGMWHTPSNFVNPVTCINTGQIW